MAQAPATAVEFPKIRQDAFDKVWDTINEKHYDPTFGGVDWIYIRELYLPKAKAAKSDQDFHNVLWQMLGELKLSHFNIFPPPPAIGNFARTCNFEPSPWSQAPCRMLCQKFEGFRFG